MLRNFLARLFGRDDFRYVFSAPHRSVQRTTRPYDAVTWPTQMPTRRFKYNDTFR